MKINPRRMNTDPCEKHFGNAYQCVVSSCTAMVTEQWGDVDVKSGLAERANYAAVGNNRCAEDHFPQFNKNSNKFIIILYWTKENSTQSLASYSK